MYILSLVCHYFGDNDKCSFAPTNAALVTSGMTSVFHSHMNSNRTQHVSEVQRLLTDLGTEMTCNRWSEQSRCASYRQV